MSSFDVVILIILVFCTVLGVYWGLIRQLLAIVGLLVGVALAGRYGSTVATWLSSFSAHEQLINVMGFFFVLISVSVATSLIASLLRLFAGLLFLGWIDHLVGGFLGLLQGVLVSAAALITFVTFPASQWELLVERSAFFGVLLPVCNLLAALLPEVFRIAVYTALR